MERPIAVRRNDFTAGIQRLVTETQLPPWALRDALTIILHQVSQAADREYDAELERWQETQQQGVEDGVEGEIQE
jgi:hypothetical protein